MMKCDECEEKLEKYKTNQNSPILGMKVCYSCGKIFFSIQIELKENLMKNLIRTIKREIESETYL